jgi:hypothetical protein
VAEYSAVVLPQCAGYAAPFDIAQGTIFEATRRSFWRDALLRVREFELDLLHAAMTRHGPPKKIGIAIGIGVAIEMLV